MFEKQKIKTVLLMFEKQKIKTVLLVTEEPFNEKIKELIKGLFQKGFDIINHEHTDYGLIERRFFHKNDKSDESCLKDRK